MLAADDDSPPRPSAETERADLERDAAHDFTDYGDYGWGRVKDRC